MAYSKEVVERFEGVLNSPQQFSVGRFDPNDPTVATGMTGAPACGDVMKLQLKLDPGNNRIVDVKFKTYGCGSAIASSTMFVEMLKGRTIDEAKEITLQVHHHGKAVAGIYSYEIAEQKMTESVVIINYHNFPLKVTMEQL